MQVELKEALEYLDEFSNTLANEATVYWKYHKKRFEWTSQLVAELAQKLSRSGNPVKKFLDIGNAYQTMIFDRLFPDAQIDTLGFFDERYATSRQTVHIAFDLNDTYDREKWPCRAEKYDIIVMMEVIEHLYTSPKLVFAFLNEMLQDHGFLLIQTPNAVSLSKRLKMCIGRNPFELIRETRSNPGHFREYTKKEMRQLAESAGLVVCESYMLNYFNDKSLLSRISSILPGTLRSGICHVLKKSSASNLSLAER